MDSELSITPRYIIPVVADSTSAWLGFWKPLLQSANALFSCRSVHEGARGMSLLSGCLGAKRSAVM